MAGEVAVPETVGANATPPHEQPEDDWRRETEQLDSLRAVVVQLVSLLTASTVAGRSTHASPGGSDRESRVKVLSGSSTGVTAAITRAEGSTQSDAAILSVHRSTRSHSLARGCGHPPDDVGTHHTNGLKGVATPWEKKIATGSPHVVHHREAPSGDLRTSGAGILRDPCAGSHPGPPLQAYMLLDAAIHPYGRQVILFRDGEINA
ncbi:unnamed protein product [Lampetra fluviatilis]